MSSNLEDNTDGVDDATDDDGPLAADDVGDITGDDGAKEGTGGQDRGNQGQVRTGERPISWVGSWRGRTFNELNERLRASYTVDVTGIITEEDLIIVSANTAHQGHR